MTFEKLARLSNGVAYRDEDRGDDGLGGGAGGGEEKKDDLAGGETAGEVAAREAEDKRVREKAEREKDIAIPKARHDEAVKKERDRAAKAEAELAEFRKKEESSKAVQDIKKLESTIADLEDQFEKANSEGTPEQRKEIRAKIREAERALNRAESKAEAAIAQATAIEQNRYDLAVDRMEADYPFLVPDSDQFNESITKDLLEMKAGFENAGMSSTEALKRATRLLKPQLDDAKKALAAGDDEAKKKAEDEAKAKAEAEAKKKKDEDPEAKKKAEAEESKRREEAVKKGQEAARGQPAKKPGGEIADKGIKEPKVKEMSDTDFDKLTPAELKRMRGD